MVTFRYCFNCGTPEKSDSKDKKFFCKDCLKYPIIKREQARGELPKKKVRVLCHKCGLPEERDIFIKKATCISCKYKKDIKKIFKV